MNKNNKVRYTIGIILITVLLVFIFSLGAYVLYNKVVTGKQKSIELSELIDKYDYINELVTPSTLVSNTYYKSDKVISSEIDNEDLIIIALEQLYKDKKVSFSKFTPTSSEIENKVKSMYGNNIKIEHKSITNNKLCTVVYDKNTKSYRNYKQSRDLLDVTYLPVFVSAQENGKTIRATYRVGFIDCTVGNKNKTDECKICKDYNCKSVFENLKEYTVKSALKINKKYDSYIFTFKKNKDKIYLYSVELVK